MQAVDCSLREKSKQAEPQEGSKRATFDDVLSLMTHWDSMGAVFQSNFTNMATVIRFPVFSCHALTVLNVGVKHLGKGVGFALGIGTSISMQGVLPQCLCLYRLLLLCPPKKGLRRKGQLPSAAIKQQQQSRLDIQQVETWLLGQDVHGP